MGPKNKKVWIECVDNGYILSGYFIEDNEGMSQHAEETHVFETFDHLTDFLKKIWQVGDNPVEVKEIDTTIHEPEVITGSNKGWDQTCPECTKATSYDVEKKIIICTECGWIKSLVAKTKGPTNENVNS